MSYPLDSYSRQNAPAVRTNVFLSLLMPGRAAGIPEAWSELTSIWNLIAVKGFDLQSQ
jgi:hypothetical protein